MGKKKNSECNNLHLNQELLDISHYIIPPYNFILGKEDIPLPGCQIYLTPQLIFSFC